MHINPDYIDVNTKLWNEKTGHHVASDFYKNDAFLSGTNTLNPPELALLGDVNGKSILHLQCHFGQDTLSLARMGAKVTGVDFSTEAIAVANKQKEQLGLEAEFICCNIFHLDELLDQQFDIVFSSYGTICWLPDMARWAAIVGKYVKPGGQFIFAEFHPAVWMFDNDFKHLQYSYFNRDIIQETETGTYADFDAPIQLTSMTWNHNFSEVIQNLLHQNLRLVSFEEFDYSPYACFKDAVLVSPGRYQIKGLEGKLPMMYTLQMVKGG